MTEPEQQTGGKIAALGRTALALVIGTVLDALRLWRIAIWIPLLVVLPELFQHGVEINLGMFDSRAAFKALSADPQRMLFGYLKVAGLVLAIIAAAGYWSRRGGHKVRWAAAGIALLLNVIPFVLLLPIEGHVSEPVWMVINVAVSIAAFPLLVLLLGALFGDQAMTLSNAYRNGWGKAVRIALLVPLGWLPLSPIHQYNHFLAMGQPQGIIWALMVWDSTIVGLMACWAGTALHHGYRGVFAKR